MVVSFAGGDVQQVLGDTAFDWVDGHIIVVEYNKQVIFEHRGVIESLKCQTACHGSIANDGHYSLFRIFFSCLFTYGYSQGCGDAIASMTSDKCIVFAFRWGRERGYTFELSIGMKTLATTCENLVGVCLVTYVPYELVVWSVKHVMQCHCQFYRTEGRT